MSGVSGRPAVGQHDEAREIFNEIAWRDFITFAFDQPEARAAFEAESGMKWRSAPSSPLDAMIDKATGYDAQSAADEYVKAFTLWATRTQWGVEYAPAKIREELEGARE